jgi:hypothetical protein
MNARTHEVGHLIWVQPNLRPAPKKQRVVIGTKVGQNPYREEPGGGVLTIVDAYHVAHDPYATPSELEQAARFAHLAVDVMKNPNCPPEVYWELMKAHPLAGLLLPNFQRLLLEDYQGWEDISDEVEKSGALPYVELTQLPVDTVCLFTAQFVYAQILRKLLTAGHRDDLLKKLYLMRDALLLFMDWVKGKVGDEKMNQMEAKVDAIKIPKHPDPYEKNIEIAKRATELVLDMRHKKRIPDKITGVFSAALREAGIGHSPLESTAMDAMRLSLQHHLYGEDPYAYQKVNGALVTKIRRSDKTQKAQIRQLIIDAYTHAYTSTVYASEAQREAEVQEEIQRAILQLENNVKEIDSIMKRVDLDNWPTWAAIGLLLGTVVLAVAAPQLAVALRIWQISGAVAARSAGAAAAAELAALASEMGTNTVSISLAELTAKLQAAESAVFLEELATKLAGAGVVIKEGASVIVRGGR